MLTLSASTAVVSGRTPAEMSDVALMELVRSIVTGDDAATSRLLAANLSLATVQLKRGATRRAPGDGYFDAIGHYMYTGDTALHMAAAAYRAALVRELIGIGADIRASNRRGAEPLHYAADGGPGTRTWNPIAQAATIACLIEAGADPNAVDKSGVAPLDRAVRTRCAAAVEALLAGGADPQQKNKSGSTPMLLARQNTGRGGSGSPAAKAEQEKIVQLLQKYGG